MDRPIDRSLSRWIAALVRSRFVPLACALVALASEAGAHVSPESAARDPAVDHGFYYLRGLRALQGRPLAEGRTAYDSARRMAEGPLPHAQNWSSLDTAGQRFRALRDLRFLETRSRPGFLRRSSWLYPDDGCFARAALAIRNMHNAGVQVPSKVFVFGNLRVQTRNSPNGYVSWWYHVAPIVEVAGAHYVLDPAIRPEEPMLLQDWLASVSDRPDSLKVSVCASGAYSPYSSCADQTDGVEAQAERDQMQYLEAEWRRLEELRRNPVEELGERPPWSPLPLDWSTSSFSFGL